MARRATGKTRQARHHRGVRMYGYRASGKRHLRSAKLGYRARHHRHRLRRWLPLGQARSRTAPHSGAAVSLLARPTPVAPGKVCADIRRRSARSHLRSHLSSLAGTSRE
jgi:hypothetical protein